MSGNHRNVVDHVDDESFFECLEKLINTEIGKLFVELFLIIDAIQLFSCLY
jgi:hypothetical protein